MKQPEFGRKVRKLRTSQGLTQSELAGRCNLALRTVQRIENGETTPRNYTARIILEALGSDSKEFVKEGWIDSLLNNVKELFNLKHNTMKKVSVLTLFTVVLFAGIFFTQTSNAQRRATDLTGVWQQVVVDPENGEIKSYIPFFKIFNADSTYVHMRAASGNSTSYFNAVGKWEQTSNDTFLEYVEPTPAFNLSKRTEEQKFKIERRPDGVILMHSSFHTVGNANARTVSETWKKCDLITSGK